MSNPDSQFERRPNNGALFRNDRKDSERQPDHTGSLLVACPHCGKTTDYWLSAWIKVATKTGARFFSIAINPKEHNSKVSKPKSDQPLKQALDDDIPF